MPRIGEGGQGFAGEDYIGIFADRERRLIAGGGGDAVGAEIFPLFVFIYDCKLLDFNVSDLPSVDFFSADCVGFKTVTRPAYSPKQLAPTY